MLNELIFFLKDNKRRRRSSYKRDYKPYLKLAGAIVFVLLIIWLIHDFIYFSIK